MSKPVPRNETEITAPDVYERLCRARRFIDLCYDLPLNLDQMSSHACFSRYHFLRLFRQAFNKTPHQYLVERRIEKAKGVMGAGVFNTDDCRRTYEELKSKGVEFLSEPTERPYGIEAVFKDNTGNWFSLTQSNPDHR